MTGRLDTTSESEEPALLDLVKRAMVGARAIPKDNASMIHDLEQMADSLDLGVYHVKLSGAFHIRRNVRSLAQLIDKSVPSDTGTRMQRRSLSSPNIRASLERLARYVEGAMESGREPGARIFYLPGWLLADRVGLTHLKPGTSFTTMQAFEVDAIGVRWLGRYRQEQNFGGRYVLRLEGYDWEGYTDRSAIEEIDFDWGSATWTRIRTKAYRHWDAFVGAVCGTAVFAAMQTLHRTDLRTALWLSRRGSRGEPRWLQFAENLPELAAQILPGAREAQEWHSARMRRNWRNVSRNASPRQIARGTWLGPGHYKLRVPDTNAAARVEAQAIASARWDTCTVLPRFIVPREDCEHRIAEVWNALDPGGLRERTWKRPDEFKGEFFSATEVLGALGRGIPASVVVRALLNSTLAPTRRSSWRTEFVDGLSDAARDLYSRSLRPQVEMSGCAASHTGRGPALADSLVGVWLKLRFGTPQERNAVADAFPDAAREARQCEPVRVRWRDFGEWSRRWHHPPRLARAVAIAVHDDEQATDRERLATPLVLEAGAVLGRNVRLIRTMPELIALGREEEHCIATYALELRTGRLHCLVLEDQDEAGRPKRSTVLIEDTTQPLPDGGLELICRPRPPYQVREIEMRRNRPSPPEHREWAEEIARQWSAHAPRSRGLQASAEEKRRRDAALRDRNNPPIPPHRVQQYWDEISRACIPQWLLDFDPSRGLLARLCRESLRTSGTAPPA